MAQKRKLIGSRKKGTQGKSKMLPSAQTWKRKRLYIPFGPSPERDALCKELGINVPKPKESTEQRQVFGSLFPTVEAKPISPVDWVFESSMWVWAQIGLKLAAERPEFNGGKRGRGRPSLKSKDQMPTHFQRYNNLWSLCRSRGEILDVTISQAAAIAYEMEVGNPLFDEELDTLSSSVSRGKKPFERAMHKIFAQHAIRLRKECNELRRCWSWAESVKPDAERVEELNRILNSENMLAGVLSPEFSERMKLREKLRKPF